MISNSSLMGLLMSQDHKKIKKFQSLLYKSRINKRYKQTQLESKSIKISSLSLFLNKRT